MQRFTFRHLVFLQGCAFSPSAQAFTPHTTPDPIQIEAPANQQMDVTGEDSALHVPTEYAEGCEMWDEPEGVDIRVRAGETLDHFARWTHSTVEELAVLNEIELRTPLLPGQALLLPLTGPQMDAFEATRTEDAEAKLARFISARGGLAGIAAHEVRSGETGWGIAKKEAQVPLWVLGAFNASRDMDTLRAGDTVYLPILGQTLGERFDAAAAAVVETSAFEGAEH